jgi:hypothetical protein
MRNLRALLIGNANYIEAGALRNPANDASDVADKLTACGFVVTSLVNASYLEMDRALSDFHAALGDQDVGLFFFAGHGVQIHGENFLAATDTRIANEIEAKHSALSLNRVLDSMENAGPATNIIILDACRDNPWERHWRRAVPQGLAPVYAPKGTLIAYSTSPGEIAADGAGRNGAYTAALLQHIDAPEVPIESMFKRVRNALAATTQSQQTSWEHTSLSGDFFFKLSVASEVLEYGPTALNDRLFVADPNKLSHRIIRGLKVLTWGRQNAALGDFDAQRLNGASADSLFVLGRNIYQAACGSAHAAIGFIDAFMERTQDLDAESRKALLDGMLFEIFFGSDGQLREYPKIVRFNEVFGLQAYEDLKPSFDFIGQCLTPAAHRFYAIPGMGHVVAAAVTVDADDLVAENPITRIFVGGRNVLREMDDIVIRRNWNETFAEEELAIELSMQMLVPRRLLTVTIDPPANGRRRVEFPRGYTVRKST